MWFTVAYICILIYTAEGKGDQNEQIHNLTVTKGRVMANGPEKNL